MSLKRWLRAIAVFVVGAGTGWIAAPDPSDTPSASPPVRTESASRPNKPSYSSQPDSVKVLPGGLLSIHADGVTRAWLESELSRQGLSLKDPARGELVDRSTAAAFDAGAETPAVESVEPERVASALLNGTEQERIAALTHALEQGIDVPLELLRETVESGPSSDLRLLAFRMYVDALSADSEDAGAALTLGTSSDDPAVRAEALARLAEFEQLRQASAAQSPP